jgi:hypothetical protein
MVALFSYEGDRLKLEIANVVAVTVMAIAISAYFITRSLTARFARSNY